MLRDQRKVTENIRVDIGTEAGIAGGCSFVQCQLKLLKSEVIPTF